MNHWRYKPDDYAIGDTIWLQYPQGWNGHNVRPYKVVKKTPGGQIVGQNGEGEVRFTKRGDVVGAGAYSRNCVCSAEAAQEIRAQVKERARWSVLADVSDKMNHAARKEDAEAYAEARRMLQDIEDKA